LSWQVGAVLPVDLDRGVDLNAFLDPASYCPLVHGFRSKSSDCRVISLMRKPFCLPFVT
jgi:hypothetical protein